MLEAMKFIESQVEQIEPTEKNIQRFDKILSKYGFSIESMEAKDRKVFVSISQRQQKIGKSLELYCQKILTDNNIQFVQQRKIIQAEKADISVQNKQGEWLDFYIQTNLWKGGAQINRARKYIQHPKSNVILVVLDRYEYKKKNDFSCMMNEAFKSRKIIYVENLVEICLDFINQ